MTDQAKVRWGILGAARVNERFLPAIVEAPNSELVAIASRRPGAAAETLAKYGPQVSGVAVYDRLEALLADDRVQAVYLPLANHEHAEWALKVLDHGKHLLCEKPMALSVSDIEAMEAKARENDLRLMEGFMYCFHPQHARFRALVDSGVIGEVRSVRATYSFMMRPARMYRLAEHFERGGGAMWDIGCYAIHAARMCMPGDPISVFAQAKRVESGADVSASGVIDFGDGRFGQFDVSFERARRSEYEIIGTKGGAKCHTVWQLPGDTPILSWWNEAGQQCEERLSPSNHFNLEIEHFSDCVRRGEAPALPISDAKMNCRTIVAALRSIESGQVEAV